ncbi:MAG: FHA domain-containing protein [Myxococcales bacterium]|nr:FHA domain-containing protein [Deltaproteobacteria bacterium]NNL26079.1 FHA domain-containing protein [Myxococcales bacterium]
MIRLRQTKGADSGRELEFDQDLIRIGRMPDSDVNFDPEVDLDASGRHAEIRSENGRYILIDAGSRNGTWLNGQRVKHAALRADDEIELGRGGPRLKVGALRGRPGRRRAVSQTIPTVPRRDPRFDALTVPGITGAPSDPAASNPDSFAQDLSRPEPDRDTARSRRGRPPTSLLWGAAGIVLLLAIAIVVGASAP